MGTGADSQGYPKRGALANGLFVSVQSKLAPVGALLGVMPSFDLGPGEVAAHVRVVADPTAPRKRFLLPEYYTRIEWLGPSRAHVETNGATGAIDWSGSANDILQAELAIFPEGAPESLGMFLRLITSMLLPTRRAVLIHASGVAAAGQGYVFLGDSGAGKTTTARRIGRDGALRFADDLTVIHLAHGQGVRVEPCSFDRGGRLPGREHRSWPLRGAYSVRKAAAITRDAGGVKDPLATWCGAILSSTGPPGSISSLLGLASDLSRLAPPHALDVSPRGAVLPAIICQPQGSAHSFDESQHEI